MIINGNSLLIEALPFLILDRAADLNAISRLQTLADAFELRPDRIGDVGRLHAIDNVRAHRDRHVAVAPPQDRLFVGIFDLGDLRQRHGNAAPRIDRQVPHTAEIQPLRRNSAGNHTDFFDAVTQCRHLHARNQHRQRLRNVLRRQAERPGAVLIDSQLEIRRLFVPVEMRIDNLVIGAHHLAHLIGDVAHGLGVRSDNAELDRKPTGGPKLKRSTRTRASDSAPLATAFSSRALIRSRRHILRHDHRFGERFVRQLRIEAEPEARRALSDIGRVGHDVLVVLEQGFRLLHTILGDIERGPLRQPQLQEQFRPLR
jgi:hypothetical protein